MKPIYLNIAVPVPLRRSFHYLPPTGQNIDNLVPGMRVAVDFGRQALVGVLLGTTTSIDIDPKKVKPALRVLDTTSIFHPTILKICRWAATYYQHPIGEVLEAALPKLLRQGESATQTEQILVARGNPITLEDLKRSPRQRTLYKLLQDSVAGLSKFELKQLDIASSVSKSLIDKGYATWTEQELTLLPFKTKENTLETSLTLNDEQSGALVQSLDIGTHLIFGITGSGKTEVYLQAIEQITSQGKQALVLVPEIGLTPQTVQRFRSRFDLPICVLHSGLNDRERLQAWRMANLGNAAIIIGTRSAIFTPMLNPGLIVIDEEHDASFKQQDGFKYSARDMAVLRGQMENLPVILGSATPSLESYQNTVSGKYSISSLTTRPNTASTASYQLIGVQHEKLDEGFSRPLIQLIGQHLKNKSQVLIFLNRRGYSPVILCRSCGWIAECTRCDARMTYHLSQGSLICHHCGQQNRLKRDCASCGSDQLVPLGLGTQRLEETLTRLFPNEKIIRIDRDSTRKKGSMEKITTEVNKGHPAILVGTQLLAKGHHFPNVTLVAVCDIDSGFYSSDYKAIERMGQLLLQVGGRAGRESKPGTVAIQTHFPDQPILQTLINDGYETFIQQLLRERSQFELPPFAFQAIIKAEAINTGLAMQFLSDIAEKHHYNPSATVLGPIPSTMEKKAGKHRAQLLLTSKDRKTLLSVLTNCISIAEQSKIQRKVRWSVDVDPVDLF